MERLLATTGTGNVFIRCPSPEAVGPTSRLRRRGTHPVTPEQAALHKAALPIVADLHLQIESYYLFAKIVLDDVAQAFWRTTSK